MTHHSNIVGTDFGPRHSKLSWMTELRAMLAMIFYGKGAWAFSSVTLFFFFNKHRARKNMPSSPASQVSAETCLRIFQLNISDFQRKSSTWDHPFRRFPHLTDLTYLAHQAATLLQELVQGTAVHPAAGPWDHPFFASGNDLPKEFTGIFFCSFQDMQKIHEIFGAASYKGLFSHSHVIVEGCQRRQSHVYSNGSAPCKGPKAERVQTN